MLTAAATTVRNFFARPGAVDAIKTRDRATALAIAAQPDPEAFAPLVDELLSNEAQRDQHRARAQQLPEVKKQFAEAQQVNADAWQAEQARRNEYDRASAARLDELANLERLKGKLEMSARWLIANIPPHLQQQIDTLTAERNTAQEALRQRREYHAGCLRGVRNIERNIESCERTVAKTNTAGSRAELGQYQNTLANAQREAEQVAADIAEQAAAEAKITATIDAILADVKAGK